MLKDLYNWLTVQNRDSSDIGKTLSILAIKEFFDYSGILSGAPIELNNDRFKFVYEFNDKIKSLDDTSVVKMMNQLSKASTFGAVMMIKCDSLIENFLDIDEIHIHVINISSIFVTVIFNIMICYKHIYNKEEKWGVNIKDFIDDMRQCQIIKSEVIK